jgi:hypothetical protein
VKDFYTKRDAEMRSRVTTNPNIAAPACEPPLVAYFLRVDPAWGEKMLRQSLAERGYTMGRCWLGIIGQTAVFNSGPVWERVAIDALQDPAVPVKIDAVKAPRPVRLTYCQACDLRRLSLLARMVGEPRGTE